MNNHQKPMKIALLLTLAALGQTTAAPQPPANEAKPIAPEFIAALQKSEQAMDALKQFSVTARLTSSLEGPSSRQGSTSTQTITAKRPDKVIIKADWAQFGESAERPQLRVLLDGNRLTTFFVPTRLVSVHEGKDAAAELAGEAIIASTLEGSGLHVLTMPEMAKFVIANTEEAKLDGTEAVGDVDCQKFEVHFSGLRLHMWLGPVERPLLRQLAETTVISQDEKSKAKLTSSRVSKISWSLDQEIPDSEFQLQLPENARRVDDILQAISRGQQESAEGKPVPDAQLKLADGKAFSSMQFKGKPVTLIFWASWANDPQATLQHAAKINAARKPGEAVYLVNVGETPEKAADLLKTVKDLPESLFDTEEDLTIELRLKAVPAMVEISPSGNVTGIR
jgi:hypothetical protein